MTKFHVGDVVHLSDDACYSAEAMSGTYEITKVPVGRAGVNYTAKQIGGTLSDQPYSGRGVKATEACLVAGPAVKNGSSDVYGRAYVKPLDPGTLVKFIGHKGLWVVVGSTDKGSRIFPLGGSSRYFTNVRPSSLVVMDVVGLASYLGVDEA